MSSFWEEYAQIVMVIQCIILDSVLKSVLVRLFSMGILVFSVLKAKYGMVLIALVDVMLEKCGLMVIVSVQPILNGMGIVVCLVLVGKHGILLQGSVYAQQVWFGMDLFVFLARLEKSLIQVLRPVFVHQALHGMALHVLLLVHLINFGTQQLSNANVQSILYGMEQIVFNVQEVDSTTLYPVNVNVKQVSGMGIHVERLVQMA